MKILIELCQIVTSDYLLYTGFIEKSRPEGKIQALFKGIAEGRFRTDLAAIKHLYGEDAEATAKYRMLKSRLTDQLYKALLYIRVQRPSSTLFFEAYSECHRSVSICKHLYYKGWNHAATFLARKTLARARKFQLSEVIVLCLRMLRSEAAFMGDTRLFNTLDTELAGAIRVLTAEYEVEALYERNSLLYLRTVTSKRTDWSRIERSTETIGEQYRRYPTNTIFENYFSLKRIFLQAAGRFEEAIALCSEAEEYYMRNSHFALPGRVGEVKAIKAGCYLSVRRYEPGISGADEALGYLRDGSNNWFIFQQTNFLLSIGAGNFQRAAAIHHSVINHPRFSYNTEFRKEKWTIFELYLQYSMVAGFTGELPHIRKISSFNLKKFLRQIPVFSKDKGGLDTSVGILQVLFLLEQGHFDQIISRIEPLMLYAKRYLRGRENSRSRHCIRMLFRLVSNDFAPGIARNAAQLFRQEGGSPALPDDAEVIPYDVIWERICRRLTEKQGSRRKARELLETDK